MTKILIHVFFITLRFLRLKLILFLLWNFGLKILILKNISIILMRIFWNLRIIIFYFIPMINNNALIHIFLLFKVVFQTLFQFVFCKLQIFITVKIEILVPLFFRWLNLFRSILFLRWKRRLASGFQWLKVATCWLLSQFLLLIFFQFKIIIISCFLKLHF